VQAFTGNTIVHGYRNCTGTRVQVQYSYTGIVQEYRDTGVVQVFRCSTAFVQAYSSSTGIHMLQ